MKIKISERPTLTHEECQALAIVLDKALAAQRFKLPEEVSRDTLESAKRKLYFLGEIAAGTLEVWTERVDVYPDEKMEPR